MRAQLRRGCFGCAGAALLLAIVVAALALIAWVQVRGDRATTTEITREPGPFAPGERPARPPGSASSVAPDAVVLDLDATWSDVVVRPVAHGRPFGLSASYDADRYALDVSTAEAVHRDRALKVRLAPRGTNVMAALRPIVGGSLPRVEIGVPAGVPVAIRARFVGGLALFDLGGLRLTDVDLSIVSGVMQVQLREPTERPVDTMRLSCRGGNLVLYFIGHASPRRLAIHQGMGPGFFDLTGEWRANADVEVSVAFGTGEVRIPEGVVVRDLEGPFERFNDPPSAGSVELVPPTLRMDVHYDVGDIRIKRIPASRSRGRSDPPAASPEAGR